MDAICTFQQRIEAARGNPLKLKHVLRDLQQAYCDALVKYASVQIEHNVPVTDCPVKRIYKNST